MNSQPSDHDDSLNQINEVFDQSRNHIAMQRFGSTKVLDSRQIEMDQIPEIQQDQLRVDRQIRYGSKHQLQTANDLGQNANGIEVDTQIKNENSEMTNEVLFDFNSQQDADYQLDFLKQNKLLKNGGKKPNGHDHGHSHGISHKKEKDHGHGHSHSHGVSHKNEKDHGHGHSHSHVSSPSLQGNKQNDHINSHSVQPEPASDRVSFKDDSNFRVLTNIAQSQNGDSDNFDRIEDFGINGDNLMLKGNLHSKCSRKHNDSKKKSFIQLVTDSSKEALVDCNHSLDSSEKSDIILEESALDESSVSDLSELENKDPLTVANEYLENYYETNYATYDIHNIKNYVHESAWSVHFDQVYDKAFVTIASIEIDEQVNNAQKMLITSNHSTVDNASKADSKTPVTKQTWLNFSKKVNKQSQLSSRGGQKEAKNIQKLAQMSQVGRFNPGTNNDSKEKSKESSKDVDASSIEKDFQMEIDGLREWNDPQVIFTLKLLTFNFDDRLIKTKTKEHQPQREKVMMKIQQGLRGSFTKFQIMQFFKNKYIDHSQILQHESTTFHFKNLYKLVSYNRVQKSMPFPPIKIFSDAKYNTFRMAFLLKDHPQKIDRDLSKVLIFGYKQKEINNNVKNTDSSTESPRSKKGADSNFFEQRIILKTVELEQLNKNSKNQQEQPTVVQQDLEIQDERLVDYYRDDLQNRQLSKILVQQIETQSSYIILFPTGLILNISIDPLMIVSMIQLSIKTDETILDYSYSICPTGKNHCIWILDSKMQVWKCSSPITTNQGSWTMTRHIKFHLLPIKLFFQQATTYDEVYMVQYLIEMKNFMKKQTNRLQQSDQLIGFNSTATKSIVVQQPVVPLRIKKSLEELKDMTVEQFEQIFCITKKQIMQNKIKIQLIAKDQNIIMSHIPFKVPVIYEKDIYDKIQNVFASKLLNKQIPDAKGSNDENEILEIQYLQKVNLKDIKTNFLRQYRQFLVRRMRCLQIMFTNGLFYWSVDVQQSHLKPPFVIQDIMLSEDNQTLVDYCSIPGYPERSFYRSYIYCSHSQNFILSKKQVAGSRDLSNMSLDDNGDVYYIKFNLTNDKVHKQQYRAGISIKNIDDQRILQIPRTIIFQQLLNAKNELPKVMTSDDGRILMCNYLIIQLSEDKQSIMEIGCITFRRQQSLIYYKFRSLLEPESRAFVQSLLKNSKQNSQIKNIVKFDIENEPFSIEKDINVLYFTNYLVDPTQVFVEGTSVIKMSTMSLSCLEIYRTKDKIVHFTLYDHDQDQEIEADMELQKEQIVSDILQNGNVGISKKDIERIYRIAQAKMPSVADLANIEAGNSPSSSEDSSPVNPDSSSFDSQNLRRKKPVIVNSGDIMQTKQQPFEISDQKSKELEIEKKVQQEVLKRMSKSLGPRKSKSYDPNLASKRRGAVLQKNTIKRKETQVMSKSKVISKDKQKDRIHEDNKIIFISLVSQTKNRLTVEIILDTNVPGQDVGNMADVINKKQERFEIQKFGSKLVHLITVNSKKEIKLTSEIGWINISQFILTLDNMYYLISINKTGMHSIRDGIKYDRHQLNGDLFVSIISQEFMQTLYKRCTTNQYFTNDSFKQNDNNQLMIKAQNVIQRMELASLIRYAFIKQVVNNSSHNNIENLLLFFTPCEEMKGGSIFTKLSSNYDIIQPYIEKIDAKFIDIMNNRIRNTNNYLNKNIENGKFVNQLRKNSIKKSQSQQAEGHDFLTDVVHMYQEDVTGKNAIDNAFEKNSIFCIKLFVDSLLQLKNEVHFKNCFDKALIMMINKGMDVKELVNSKIFYTPLWTQHIIFSASREMKVRSYNNDILDLYYENPHEIFNDETVQKDVHQYLKGRGHQSMKGQSMRIQGGVLSVRAQISQGQGHMCKSQCESIDQEQYEMQFNCINLELICQEFKFKQFDLIKALKSSNDLQLFELEPIQCIINFKWEAYGRSHFKKQLFIYCFYVISFYADMITIHTHDTNGGVDHKRNKNLFFWLNKMTCILVQLYFLVYKIMQLFYLNQLYYDDTSSYLQVTSIILYIVGAGLDIYNDVLPPLCQIIYGTSCIFSLANVLFLIRVYQQLSFLVILMTKVIEDLFYFLLLFIFFVNQIGVCFMILEVDSSAYGRQPYLLSMTYSTLRAAFGDFSILDPYMTFDMYTENEFGEKEYTHPTIIVTFTFLVFIFQSFILFMVFMNFIIAIIGDSYSAVIEYRDAHDYKQRTAMIFERELFLPMGSINDQEMFPKFLIVRKMKQTDSFNEKPSLQSQIKQIKTFIQEQSEIQKQQLTEKSNEQKDHQQNSIKQLEIEFTSHRNQMMKQLTQIQKSLKVLTKKQLQTTNFDQTGNNFSGSNDKDSNIHIINYSSNGSVMDMNSSNYGYDLPFHDIQGPQDPHKGIQMNNFLIKQNPKGMFSDPTSPKDQLLNKSHTQQEKGSQKMRWRQKMNQLHLTFDNKNVLQRMRKSSIDGAQTKSQEFNLKINTNDSGVGAPKVGKNQGKEVLRRFNDPSNPIIRKALEQRKMRAKSQIV